MSSIGQYLFSVLIAALLTTIVCIFVSEKTSSGLTLKIICGIFLVFTAISPVLDIHIIDLSDYWSTISEDTQHISAYGIESSLAEQKTIINEYLTAYVLEKAHALNLDVDTYIEFNNDSIPTPYKIYFKGNASPYAREELTQYITENLGIPEEHLIWN